MQLILVGRGQFLDSRFNFRNRAHENEDSIFWRFCSSGLIDAQKSRLICTIQGNEKCCSWRWESCEFEGRVRSRLTLKPRIKIKIRSKGFRDGIHEPESLAKEAGWEPVGRALDWRFGE